VAGAAFDWHRPAPSRSLWRVPKWLKFIVGVLLLPVCAGAALALWKVISAQGGDDVLTARVALLAGVGCWLAVFIILPKPMWIYVLGHELTHAVWAWLFGGEVKRMKVTSKGGHVIVTKTNFVIALAPYFFPLYAALVVAVFVTGHLIWGWNPFRVWFHLLLGAAYAFHVTLTLYILQSRQTDITEHGYLFSAAVIFLGNAAVLLFGLPLLAAKVNYVAMIRWWGEGTINTLHFLRGAF
jgi:hypothetical protein